MKNKKLINWWKTSFSAREVSSIKMAISKGHIVQGSLTAALEARLSKLLEIPYVLLTTNGSTALLAALIACGIEPNDEVIIPNLTFIATAQAPLLLGARVRLADTKINSPLVDVKEVGRLINSKTKAIMLVHLNGRAAEVQGVKKLAKRYGLKVIEDAAQAFYSRNSDGYLGCQSDFGIFSLGITKLITTVQGGVLVTRDKWLFERAKEIRNHGRSLNKTSKTKFDILGFNFKFNDILAAIGLSQIKLIEEKFRRHLLIYNFYKNKLKDIAFLKLLESKTEVGELPLWIEVLSPQRSQIIALLAKNGIQAKPFDPVLSDACYIKNKNTLKFSKLYSNFGFILPSGPNQKEEDLKYIVKVLRDIQNIIKLKPKEGEVLSQMTSL